MPNSPRLSCELVVEDVEAGPCIKNQFLMSIFSPQLRVYHHFGTSTFNFHGFLNDFCKALPSEYHIHPERLTWNWKISHLSKGKDHLPTTSFQVRNVNLWGLPALTSGGRGISRVLAAALAKLATASASALATLVRLAHGVRHFLGGKPHVCCDNWQIF